MNGEVLPTYKMLVLGDSNVGKTCIVHRFCDESYYDTYISTIGVDFKQKIIDLDGIPVKLQIWDTAGQERFRTLTTAYYRGAMGILLLYDVTNLESFNNLGYWLRNIEENASPTVVKVLVGNKCDDVSHRAVRIEDGNKLSSDFDIPLFEVSCKANVNVDQVFLTLARNIKLQRDSKIMSKIWSDCMKRTPVFDHKVCHDCIGQHDDDKTLDLVDKGRPTSCDSRNSCTPC